jgi:hypothetical protein
MPFVGFSRPFGTYELANANPAVNCRAIVKSPSGRKPTTLGSRRGRSAGAVAIFSPWSLLLLLSFELLSLGLSSARAAESVTITPSADTALLQNFPSNNFGGMAWLNSGTTQIFTTNRGLLKFNVAAHVPRGAQILSASLVVEVVGHPVDGDTPNSFELHRMLRDWGEGDKTGFPPSLGAPATEGEANWTHRFALTTNAWATPGGLAGADVSPVASVDTFIYGEDFSPYTFDSTPRTVADVQTWLDEPALNFGWMLISASEELNFTARRFASREDTSRAPALTIEYFAPRIDSVTVSNQVASIRFTAEADHSYSLEYCDLLARTPWLTLTNLPISVMTVPVLAQDSNAPGQRYYRLRVQ